MQEQASKRCSVIWGTEVLHKPCCLHPGWALLQHPCPELMVRASTVSRQLLLPVLQMLDCSDLTGDLDCALTIFPRCLQSKCLDMPSLALRGIFKLLAKPSMVRRGQRSRVEQWVMQWLVLFWARGAVLTAASSPACLALCPARREASVPAGTDPCCQHIPSGM